MHKRQAKDTFSLEKIVQRDFNFCPLHSGLLGTSITSVTSITRGRLEAWGEKGGMGEEKSPEHLPRIHTAQFKAVNWRLEE